MKNKALPLLGLLWLGFMTRAVGQEVRIKDIASIKGNRPNHVIGLGLVVGLQSTGDSAASLTTNQVVSNLITTLGIENQGGLPTASVAAVLVSAELPAFARNGTRIDVTVSVIGDAKSLAGGMLVPTRLKAGNGDVYVVANGQLVIGQATGSGVQTLTGATVVRGGMVEREFIPDIAQNGQITLNLDQSDFTTSAKIASSINQNLKGFYAESSDPLTIKVTIPPLFQTRIVEFVAELEQVTVKKDMEAMVVINEKTGTIVLGAEVTIMPIVISHGDLSIQIGEGKTAKKEWVAKVDGATVGNLVKSLNSLGLGPKDMVGIFQGIHAAGALNAKLKVM